MACFDRVSLGFLLHLCLWLFHQVDGTVINIYSSLEPYSILANLSRPGWTNYTLEASNTDEHVTLLQILSIVQQTDYCEWFASQTAHLYSLIRLIFMYHRLPYLIQQRGLKDLWPWQFLEKTAVESFRETCLGGNSRFRYLSSSLRSSSLHVLYRITEFATYDNRVRY